MDLFIEPARLRGTITPPPSKSQAHRLLLAAALADGESVISNVAFSQDILATLSCMEQLGAQWQKINRLAVRVTGVGAGAPILGEDGLPHFDCGESGSTLRFLIPIALAVAGGGVFTGRGRLMERPQKPYFDLFDEKGIRWEQKDGVLTVRGRLAPGEYRLPGDVSSQFFTGLLYALPLLDGPSRICSTTALESRDYIVMTMQTLAMAGVQIEEEAGPAFAVRPGRYGPIRRSVEADWSQAGFWYAAAHLGSGVEVRGLEPDSAQGDRVIADWAVRLSWPGDLELDVSGCPDLVPPLAAMAAVRRGTTLLSGAARLRIKESDRLASVTQALRALGAEVEEGADHLRITGRESLAGGAEVDACNDHRIAMMTAVAATACVAPVTLRGAACVKKSYPDFWEDYAKLGGKIRQIGEKEVDV